MKNKKKFFVIVLVVFILCILLFYSSDFSLKSKSFSVDSFLLKSVVKQGEKTTNELKVTNTDSVEHKFDVAVNEMNGLVSVDETEFTLSPKEKKKLTVVFDDYLLEPGVYVGNILISSDSEENKVPLIFEIQSQKSFFVTNLDVSPEYKKIAPGGKSITEISFFNLNDSRTHNADITYLIKNFDGEIFVSENEKSAISSQSKILKTIVLPEDIKEGKYVFIAITEYGGATVTSSYLFDVKKDSLLGNFAFVNNSVFIVILLFLLIVVFLTFYMIYERNKLFLELRRQQSAELRNYQIYFEKKKKESILKTKPKERKTIIKKIKAIKKKTIKKIKEKHQRQKIIFKKLRKYKKREEMQRKLSLWKKQGFNTSEFKHISSPQKTSQNIKKLKKRGFDVSAIEK